MHELMCILLLVSPEIVTSYNVKFQSIKYIIVWVRTRQANSKKWRKVLIIILFELFTLLAKTQKPTCV